MGGILQLFNILVLWISSKSGLFFTWIRISGVGGGGATQTSNNYLLKKEDHCQILKKTMLSYSRENNQGIVFPSIATHLKILL